MRQNMSGLKCGTLNAYLAHVKQRQYIFLSSKNSMVITKELKHLFFLKNSTNMAVRCLALLVTINSVFVSYGFLDSLFGVSGVNKGPDVFCIVSHCASQSLACGEDSNCRNSMECMTKCGFTNHSCMFECVNTYEDPIFDSMMKCLVDDYKCLELIPADPSYRCSPPKQVVQHFDLAQLTGSWWVVRGLNRDYDCFDCQLSTYRPMTTSKNYTLEEKYDVSMLNGSIRHRVAHQQVQQKNVKNGGLLDYTNTIMGLTMYEKWQVLDYATSGNYMIVYYCGHLTDTWWYEGSIVYSRQPTLAPDDLTAVTSSLRTLGYDIDDYCSPNTMICQA